MKIDPPNRGTQSIDVFVTRTQHHHPTTNVAETEENRKREDDEEKGPE